MFLTQNGAVISTNGRRILISKATSLQSLAVLPAVACLLAASSAFAQAPNNNEGLGNKADKVLVSFTDTGLTEAQQNAQGLLVPLNNDWDDASRTAATATPPNAKKPDWDNDELKTEDNEVLTAKLSFKANPAAAGNEKIVTEHGKWYLTYPAERLAVWWVAPGQTAWSRLATGTEVPVDSLAAGVTVNLKIEGKGVSAAFKADSITASFKFIGDDDVDGMSKLDVTVFQADLKIAGTDDLNEDNPGACAFLNDSQDEGNKESAATDAKTLRDNQPDFAAGHRIKLTPTPDPDIEDVEINVLPKDLKGKWSLKYTNTALLFWKEDGTAQIASETDSAEFTVPATGTFQVKLKLEAIKKEKTTATLTFKPTDYPKTFDDPVVVDVAQVDLDSDSDRSGDVEGNDAEDDIETDAIGSIILVNRDDDNADHIPDSADAVINGADDVADLGKLMLRKLPGTLPENAEIRLIANPNLRLFKGRQLTSTALTAATGAGYTANTYIIPRADILADDITLGVEGINYPDSGQARDYDLILEIQVGAKIHRDLLKVRLAPFIMLPNTQSASKLFVGNWDTAFKDAIDNATTTPLTEVTTSHYMDPVVRRDPDVWMQDEVEIGYAKAPYGQMHVVLDLPRNRGLDTPLNTPFNWPAQELLGPNVAHMEHDLPQNMTRQSFDYGGNLEVSGPVTIGTKEYPQGRIVTGASMTSSLRQLLAEQGVQSVGAAASDIVTCDTSWLAVGHVDEVISFVPSGRPHGFSVLISDTNLGRKICEDMYGRVSGKAPDVTATMTTTKLEVAGAGWTGNQFQDGVVGVQNAAGAYQIRRIVSNNANTITIAGTWTPITVSEFSIWPRSAFATFFYGNDGATGDDKEVVGVATDGAWDTLVDTTQNWNPAEFQKTDNYCPTAVLIVAGQGRGQLRQAYALDNHTLGVSPNWDSAIGPDSVYVLLQRARPNEQYSPADPATGEPEVIPYPVFFTAGEIRNRVTFKSFNDLNDKVQLKINDIRAKLVAGLGLEPEDFIEVPALYTNTAGFEDVNTDTTTSVRAWMPGMVNLQVAGDGLLIPKPFGPRIGNVDQFEAKMLTQITPTGKTGRFVDDWYTYHLGTGQIHCGTNVLRQIPDTKWWQAAG